MSRQLYVVKERSSKVVEEWVTVIDVAQVVIKLCVMVKVFTTRKGNLTRDLKLKLGHATAPTIITSINELPITTLIPNQSDVVQKIYLQLPNFG